MIFTFKCYNVFFWIHGNSHKTWVVNVFNLVISKVFFSFELFTLNSPQYSCDISSLFIYLIFFCKSSLENIFSVFLISYFAFWFTNKINTVVGICQNMILSYIINHVFFINLSGFLVWKGESLNQVINKTYGDVFVKISILPLKKHVFGFTSQSFFIARHFTL